MALTGGVPVFPPEIISHVIASIDVSELTYTQLAKLWLVARQVSKQFLEEFPKALGHKILPELAIEYDLDKDILSHIPTMEYYSTEENLKDNPSNAGLDIIHRPGELHMSLRFDHFSKDGVVAFFKARSSNRPGTDVTIPPPIILQDVFFYALDYYNRKHASFAKGPHHMTYLRGVLNDISPPGFSVDKEKREVGLDWRELCHKLFTEEVRCTVDTPDEGGLNSTNPALFGSSTHSHKSYVKRHRELHYGCRKQRFDRWFENAFQCSDAIRNALFNYHLAQLWMKTWLVRHRIRSTGGDEYEKFKYWNERIYGRKSSNASDNDERDYDLSEEDGEVTSHAK